MLEIDQSEGMGEKTKKGRSMSEPTPKGQVETQSMELEATGRVGSARFGDIGGWDHSGQPTRFCSLSFIGTMSS